LPLIEEQASYLVWSILWLWAVGELGDGRSMVEFEDQIGTEPKGVTLSWAELVGLAARFDQVIDGVFVGCKSRDEIPGARSGPELYGASEIVIEVVDSDFVAFFAKDSKVVDQVSARFKNVVDAPIVE
jgi:hypothetical protein